MAWSVPLTAVASQALTANQWNASVRDNLLETPAAKATTSGTIFAGTGPNGIAERFILDSVVETGETSTSLTYASLATNGPQVSIVTGNKAMVWINVMQSNGTAGVGCWTSFEVSGATSTAAADGRGLYHQNDAGWDSRSGVCTLITTTPGTNVFRMMYRVASASTGTFRNRRIQVMAL